MPEQRASHQFSDSYRWPDGEPIRWTTILPIGEGATLLGITDQGIWAVGNKNGVVELSDAGKFVAALPILELNLPQFRSDLALALEQCQELYIRDHSFPLVTLVSAGLNQGSDFWAGLALQWLRDFPSDDKAKLKEKLADVCNASWASQKTRQEAARIQKSLP